jgi:predicted MFS family arabinose efflux permease
MLLLSPGLALFLFGVSSIPEAQQKHEGYHVLGLYLSDRVWITALLGVVLIAAFVPWALRRSNVHPLVDLRLFQHKEITIAVIAMALFAIAFFGATLLFPLYFQQVHGDSPLKSGWMLAPQGFGAMLTRPIAGVLADRIGPGKVVLTGLLFDTVGMGFFAFVGSHDSYAFLVTGLIIMGLGMGATMMPIMSAALARLTDASVARGSTLMNINQQVASSIGTALFSVLLTSALNSSPHDIGGSYGHVFLIATILVACCFAPAVFLPRTKTEAPAAAPVPMH